MNPTDESARFLISNFQPIESCGVLKANFSITLSEYGLQIDGWALCSKGNARWISAPRRKSGPLKVPICSFTDDAHLQWFTKEVLHAVDQFIESNQVPSTAP